MLCRGWIPPAPSELVRPPIMKTKFACLLLSLLPCLPLPAQEALLHRRDYTADGYADLLCMNASGTVEVWPSTNSPFTFGSAVMSGGLAIGDPSSVRSVDFVDLDGNGKTDVLIEQIDSIIGGPGHRPFGRLRISYLDGINWQGSAWIDGSEYDQLYWAVIGVGDFNGSGRLGVLFKSTDGRLMCRGLGGTGSDTMTWVGTIAGMFNPSVWTPFAVADMNNDGNSDILFKSTDGRLCVWFMDGVSNFDAYLVEVLRTSVTVLPNTFLPSVWTPVSVADYNNDTLPDILFQKTDKSLCAWFMNGTTRQSAAVQSPTGWIPSYTADWTLF